MKDPGTDPRSELTSQIIAGGSYDKLVVSSGTPAQAWNLLGKITPDQLFTVPIVSIPAAYACLAGLWLWLDGLSESHEIAQKTPSDLALFPHQTPSKTGLKVQSVESVGSDKAQKTQQLEDMTASLAYWHAVMHRREGDFSNAKYWYARCTRQPVLAAIAANAGGLLNPLPAEKAYLRLTAGGQWNGATFVDLVEQVHRSPDDPRYALAISLQQLEWRMLFDHCTRAAVGK